MFRRTYTSILESPHRVQSHAPSIRSHRGTKVVRPDFQPMRVPEEPVCINLFRKNPVFTFLHLKSPVHVVPPQASVSDLVAGGREGVKTTENKMHCSVKRYSLHCSFSSLGTKTVTERLCFALSEQRWCVFFIVYSIRDNR